MIDTALRPTATIDDLELEIVACERMIGRLRARQLAAIRVLDTEQVRHTDGSRSMADWTAARLDVTAATARHLFRAAQALTEHPDLEAALDDGEMSFDRAVATADLAASGANDAQVAASFGFDLHGVARQAGLRRRMTRTSERQAFRDRHLAIQPSLDLSHYRGWFSLPGFEGSVVEKALRERADEFPEPGDTQRAPGSTRMADALMSIAQDSLDPVAEAAGSSSAEPLVSIFVDADMATATHGEAGAEVAAGPRVGPATLDRILCGGRVQVIWTDRDRPFRVSRSARTIPPALRRTVLHRDGSCVVDGCTSRYRLQVHHIRPRAEGGGHHPANLATLCWYHHQVAIHGEGYRIDPDSLPRRRRLIPPARTPDPP